MMGFKPNALFSGSIKNRVTLFTLGILLFSLWALSFYVSSMLRQDMQRLLGEQQFSVVSLIANDIDHELSARKAALEQVASGIDTRLMASPSALHTLLEQRPILQSQFNGGFFVTDAGATVIAGMPLSAGRTGANYMDREMISVPVKEGKTVIGRPVMGKKLMAPVFAVAAPIRDARGQVIGALVGVINLGLPNFLDQITHGKFGISGGFLLIAPDERLVVTASDKRRIMEILPAAGLIPGMDHVMDGFDGTEIFVNARGSEVMNSGKTIAITGWRAVVTVPVAEAFAPVRNLQQRLLMATILLTVLTGTLTWWMLGRQLAPLHSTAKVLSKIGHARRSVPVLPVTRQDEIGELLDGFNQLLQTLSEHEAKLRQSEEFKSDILNAMTFQIAVVNHKGVIVAVNAVWSQFALDNSNVPGQSAPHTGIGVNYLEMCQGPGDPGEGPEARQGILQVLQGRLPSFSIEYPCHAPDKQRWFALVATPIGDSPDANVVITHTDITERKLTQIELTRYRDHLEEMVAQQTEILGQSNAALRESEALFRLLALNTSDGLAVFENNIIAYVSPTYLTLSGFERQEELGRGEDAIRSLIHPDDVERVLGIVHSAIHDKLSRTVYTYRARHKKGHYIWREDSTRFTYDDTGQVRRIFVVAKDVSARIEVEATLQRSTEMLERTGAVAKVGGWEIDVETMQVDWSTQVFLIFEREPCGPQTVEQASSNFVPESQVRFRTAMAQALEQGTQWDLELQAVTDKDQVRWIHTLVKAQVTDGKVVRVFGSVHDVTEGVLSRLAVEKNQQALQVIFDNQQTGVSVFSETALLYCNPAFRSLLGYTATQPLEHLTMGSLVPSTDQNYLSARHNRAKTYNETLPPKLMKLSGNGGAVISCLISGSIVPWDGEPQFLASVTALGDSVRMEQEIRASEDRYERLLVTQLEKQQAHIARELHDSMGSRLAGVVMLLGGVVQKRPELGPEIQMALEQIQIAAQSSRAMAHSLVPVDALPGAFWRSLERLCQDYAKLAGVQCLFSMEGDFEEVDAETGNHLFRIAQEALVNAVKHGHASRIVVRLEKLADSLAMTIVDNGGQVVLQPGDTRSSSSSGIGLKSMQARASIIGGAFKWFVNGEGGVTVSIVWGLGAT
jgi:PAS domain S-box-containing protein